MDRHSIWWIRGALIYLVLGVTLGALLLLHKTWSWDAVWWRLLPLHIYTMLLGFTIPFILGVAHWILPRTDSPNERGNPKLIFTAWFIWNIGLILWIIFNFIGINLLAVISILCNISAVLTMFSQLWRRIATIKKSSKTNT